MQSSSLISELIVKYKLKELWIACNYTIGEDQQFYSMLINPSNVQEGLDMMATQLSSRAATDLFTALKDNNKLKELSTLTTMPSLMMPVMPLLQHWRGTIVRLY